MVCAWLSQQRRRSPGTSRTRWLSLRVWLRWWWPRAFPAPGRWHLCCGRLSNPSHRDRDFSFGRLALALEGVAHPHSLVVCGTAQKPWHQRWGRLRRSLKLIFWRSRSAAFHPGRFEILEPRGFVHGHDRGISHSLRRRVGPLRNNLGANCTRCHEPYYHRLCDLAPRRATDRTCDGSRCCIY